MLGMMAQVMLVLMATAALLEVVRHLAKRGRLKHDALSGREAGPPPWLGPAQVIVVIAGFALVGYLIYRDYNRMIASIPPELKGVCPPPGSRYDNCRNR